MMPGTSYKNITILSQDDFISANKHRKTALIIKCRCGAIKKRTLSNLNSYQAKDEEIPCSCQRLYPKLNKQWDDIRRRLRRNYANRNDSNL